MLSGPAGSPNPYHIWQIIRGNFSAKVMKDGCPGPDSGIATALHKKAQKQWNKNEDVLTTGRHHNEFMVSWFQGLEWFLQANICTFAPYHPLKPLKPSKFQLLVTETDFPSARFSSESSSSHRLPKPSPWHLVLTRMDKGHEWRVFVSRFLWGLPSSTSTFFQGKKMAPKQTSSTIM